MRQPDIRALAEAFGGPLFVPAGDGFRGWEIRGVHKNGGVPVGVLVLSLNAGRTLQVDTDALEFIEQPLYVELANLLQSSVPRDVELPFTIRATERRAPVPVDGVDVEFQIFETASAWRARAVIHGRRVSMASRDLPIEEIRLSRLDAVPGDAFASD